MTITKRLKVILVLSFLIVNAISYTSCFISNKPQNEDAAINSMQPISLNNQDVDAVFLRNAAEINIAQINLSKLVESNYYTSEVCDLGKAMETRHRKLYDKLKLLATEKSITLPTVTNRIAQNEYDKLSSYSGFYFDKIYCFTVIQNHRDAIITFDRASKECNDTDIKKFAESGFNELRQLLHEALTIQKKIIDKNRMELANKGNSQN